MKRPATKGINVPLLRAVQREIRAEPKRFRMEQWIDTYDSEDSSIPRCGTAGCIAGWAMIILARAERKNKLESVKQIAKGIKTDVDEYAHAHRQSSLSTWVNRARRKLGLTAKQAKSLFFEDAWPEKFRKAYEEGSRWGDRDAMAKAGVNRINHFIKTKGRE